VTCRPTCIQPSPSNAHCGACHHTFSGVSAFDRHRRGGECINPRDLGLHADPRGVWRYPAPDPTKRAVWPQRDEVPAAPVDLMAALKASSSRAADHQARLAEEAS
jgi:hypothetical protein